MSKFVVIQPTLDMWNKSLQQIAEEQLDRRVLDTYKPVGLSHVYSVVFTIDECDDDFDEDDEMCQVVRRNDEYFCQDPSYEVVVDFIKEHTDEYTWHIYEDNIVMKQALVLELKNA